MPHRPSSNTKNVQLHSTLIAYLIVLLINIPQIWGNQLLDNLRYLPACMSQEFSYLHWIDRILRNRPIRLYMATSDLYL